jgi:hypothetical protein
MTAKKILLDVAGLTGLGMLAYGLWLVAPCVMFIVIGGLVLAYSVITSMR